MAAADKYILKIFAGMFKKSQSCSVKTKPKILVVDNSPGLTGAYKSISTITTELGDDFQFYFCLPKGSSLLKMSAKVRTTIELPFSEIRRHLKVVLYVPILFANSIRLLRFIKRNDIDIIHVNDLYNLVGVVIKLIHPRMKVIYHVRLLPSSYSGRFYSFWIWLIQRYSNHILCVSQTVKEHVQSQHRLHSVLFDAIETKGIQAYKQLLPGDELQLLYIANYTEGKGHDDAIKALGYASKKNANLRLLMVGDDFGLKKNQAYKASLRRLAEHQEVADKVVFRGFAQDTSSLFKSADIFLNFSKSESFSLTCLEALFHGLPVIATDSGGPAEFVKTDVSGILVPVGDVLAMGEAIVRLSKDKALRDGLARRGNKHVIDSYSSFKSAEQLKDIYLNVMSNSH